MFRQEDPSSQIVSLHSSESSVNQKITACFLKPLFCLRKLLRFTLEVTKKLLGVFALLLINQFQVWFLSFPKERSDLHLLWGIHLRAHLHLTSWVVVRELSLHRTLLKEVFSQGDLACPVCVFTFWFGNVMCMNLQTKFLVQAVLPALGN